METSEISRRDSKICKWLALFGETYNRSISAELTKIWLRVLSELSAKQLDMACNLYLKMGQFFPTPAGILELAGKGPRLPSATEDINGEKAWKNVLHYADRWHPDIGPMTGNQGLSERELFALRSIGGVYAVWENQDGGKSLPFLRRDFIAIYKRTTSDLIGELPADTRPEPRQLGEGMTHISKIKVN